jgi:hypothetical protein
LFGFSGQNARNSLFVGFFLRGLSEPTGEFLIADGLHGFQKGQESVDLLRRQSVDNLVKPLQVTHDYSAGTWAPSLQYIAPSGQPATPKEIGWVFT